MNDKLSYYRSLTYDELLELPMEQYCEYLALLVDLSNRHFYEYMEDIDAEKPFSDDIETPPSVPFFGIHLPAYSDDEYYSIYKILPMRVLIDEYLCACSCLSLYLNGADYLVHSPIREYLDGLVSIMSAVIAERVCALFVTPNHGKEERALARPLAGPGRPRKPLEN